MRAAPLLLAVLPACAADPAIARVRVVGSDSEVNLVQRLAEAFMAERPDVAVAVTGGGSGTGIAALIGRTTEVANSSRPLDAWERLLAHRNGVDPVATLFATDALSVVVHADNPVSVLSAGDVGRLYRGEIASWAALGGPDRPPVAYGRQPSSGTWHFFRDVVLGADYHPSVREMSGSAQILEAVRQDPGGIGYVAVGYLTAGVPGVNALHLVGDDGVAVDPLDPAAVSAGTYPLARPLYQLTDGVPEGAVADFLRFELSPRGEAVAATLGFYPLLAPWRSLNGHLDVDDGAVAP